MDDLYQLIEWDKTWTKAKNNAALRFLVNIGFLLIKLIAAFIITISVYALLNIGIDKLHPKSEDIECFGDFKIGEAEKHVVKCDSIDNKSIRIFKKGADEVEYEFGIIYSRNPDRFGFRLQDSTEYYVYQNSKLGYTLNSAYRVKGKIDVESFYEILSQDIKSESKSIDKKSIKKLVKKLKQEVFPVMKFNEIESASTYRRIINGDIQFVTCLIFFLLSISLLMRRILIIRQENIYLDSYDVKTRASKDELRTAAYNVDSYNFRDKFLGAKDYFLKSPFTTLMQKAIDWKTQNTPPEQIPGLLSILNENLEKNIRTAYSFPNYIA